MASIRLKYVHTFTDRHGKRRHYFRRGAKSGTLPGIPGSVKFMDAYAAALADQKAPVSKSAQAAPGTFRALALAYYTSPDFQRLKATTRPVYKRVIDHFLEEHGQRRVDQMKRSHVKKLIGAMSDRPGAGIILLKRIRTLIRFAMDLDWIDVDPTHNVRSYRSKPFHTWDEEEIAQFQAYWPVGTKQRLAFALHLYTGQRGSDIHRMTWGDILDGRIRVVQEKTGAKVAVPLHPELAALLALVKREHVAILTTEWGKAFSVKGFGQYISSAIQKAGLPTRCKAHGLRKSAARRLAEAGCTPHQIMAITGHKTLAEVERYTADANRERLGDEAIQKQVANDGLANRVATRPTRSMK